MRKTTFTFIFMVLLGGGAISMLNACAYTRPAGQWATLDVPGIYFSGVEMSEVTKDSVYPSLCVEAQNEITAQLSQRLAAQIKPLTFHAPQKHKKTDTENPVLKMTITKCEVDVKQWDASFTYYLSLNAQLTLIDNEQTVMTYSMETYEQVQTDVPNPSFDFSFEEPIARTLILFDNGRVWIAHEN